MSEIDFLSIAELGARYRRKALSPVEVTERALSRIKALDGKLNAFITLLEKESLAEAATAERELAQGIDRGPLHGVPIAIKDLIAMAGAPTTFASRAGSPQHPAEDAVLVKNPFYFKPQMTSDVYLAHYTAVADASPVPVIVYNVPVFTGVPLQSKLVIELSKHPNILGMKDSSGDVKLISEVVWNTDASRFQVMAGAAATLFPAMTAGARGGIIAIACAAPKPALALYRAFASGDYGKAGAIQRIIAPAAGAVTQSNGIPGLKSAMELQGFEAGLPRRPLLPLKQDQREELAQVFRRMNSELAEIS